MLSRPRPRRIRRENQPWITALVTLTLCSASSAHAVQAKAEQPTVPDREPSTFALQKAVDRGLRSLARRQRGNGSWHTPPFEGSVGLVALATLAFMAEGHLPTEGEYQDNVRRGIQFVLNQRQPEGLLGSGRQQMYNHGLATLLLAEALGTTGNTRTEASVDAALNAAVRLIVRCQATDGGWDYHARPSSHDTSLSVMQLMALRAAGNCGVEIPPHVIERGLQYVEANFNRKQGGFAYRRHGPPKYTMTAAGVVSMQVSGRLAATDGHVRRGLEYLVTRKAELVPGQKHYYYGLYYAGQAAFQAGGKVWQTLFPQLARELLQEQRPQGYWQGQGEGPIMATSIAVIVLSARKRYLPIYVQEQR